MRSVLSLLLLALPLALADHQPHVNHRELAKRAKGDVAKRNFSGARWTFYSTGLGACGGTNSDSDFIVALNQDTFGNGYPSPYCWKMISMTYNGKTTQAQVVDSCPGCPSPGGLDLSPGLFSFFASQDDGVIYGTWSFVDGSGGGGGGGDTTTTTKKATTTSTKHTTTSTTPTPTSTYTPPTSTYTPPTTSTHKSSTVATSSKPSSSSVTATPTLSNSLAAASGTVSATSTANPENLYTFAQLLLDITGLVVDGANAN
ncbi:plant expansin [Mycena galericulata]|nr:plant expansin [Mycena galericulata]